MPEYVGSKLKSEEWGVDQSKISKWCREGKIPGANQDKKGSPWRIPVNAKKPE
ncbi:helix-turn-helix domain-containing protein [Olsenella sp. YH-ols2221]